MAEKLGDAVLELSTDNSKLNKGVDEGKKKATGLEKEFQKIGTRLLTFGGAYLAITKAISGVVRLIGQSVDAYKTQLDAEVKLEAALKATGNQIGYSADELKNYASELSNATGIADEAIIGAEGLMTTFTQIGHEVFPEAIEAAADMSTMFGQDLQQSVIQLGTALNDPIAGVGRLKRIGVSFTEAQKESIAAFMEQNDVMGAQRVILDEIAREFGGVARAAGETSVAALNKLKNAYGDLQEEAGRAITDGMKPFALWLTQVLRSAEAAAKQIRLVNEAMAGYAPKTAAAEMQAGLDALRKTYQEYESGVRRVANTQYRTKQEALDAIMREMVLLSQRINLQEIIEKAQAEQAKKASEQAKKAEEKAKTKLAVLDKIGEAEKDIAKYAFEQLTPEDQAVAKLQEQIDRFAILRDEARQHGVEYSQIQQHINELVAARDTLLQGVTATEEEALIPAKSMLETFRELEPAIEAPMTAIEVMRDRAEELKEAADEATEAIKEWLQPVGNFADQLTMALGTLAVEGEKGWDAFKTAMKNALAATLEAFGTKFSVLALEKWAEVFGGNVAMIGSALEYSAASAAALLGAGAIRALGQGDDFYTSGRQLLEVGDNPGGVEHVQVTPVSSGAGSGGDTYFYGQIVVDGQKLFDFLTKGSRNRRFLIDRGSIS